MIAVHGDDYSHDSMGEYLRYQDDISFIPDYCGGCLDFSYEKSVNKLVLEGVDYETNMKLIYKFYNRGGACAPNLEDIPWDSIAQELSDADEEIYDSDDTAESDDSLVALESDYEDLEDEAEEIVPPDREQASSSGYVKNKYFQNSEGLFTCLYARCSDFFCTSRAMVYRHFQKEHQGTYYQCSQCSYQNYRKDVVKSHLKSTHKLIANCKGCDAYKWHKRKGQAHCGAGEEGCLVLEGQEATIENDGQSIASVPMSRYLLTST